MDFKKGARNTSKPAWPRPAYLFRAAALIATLCAVGMIWLAEQSWYKLTQIISERETLQMMHTAAGEMTGDLLTAESGQRGFLLTSDQQFLETYERARTRIARQLKFLQAAAPAAVQQSGLLSQFTTQAQDKLREMALALHLAQDQKAPDAAKVIVDSASSPPQPYDFRAGSKQLTGFIDELIQTRQTQLDEVLNASRVILILGVLLAWISFMLYVRQKHRLQEAGMQRQKILARRSDRWQTLAHGRAEQLAELATYLQRASEDERARLARELHDELGSLMTAAKLDVARLKSRTPADAQEAQARLRHLDALLGQSIALGRRIIEDLRPSSLSTLGLTAALETLASDWQTSSGIRIRTTLEEVDLPEPRELTIFRLVQEGLTNISKYARASHAEVALTAHPTHVEVAVSDDGTGFDPQDMTGTTRGLAGMRHRLESCGGSLEIHSAPQRGTRIVGVIPRTEG